MDPLFKRLAYIYVGTSNYPEDYNYYKNILKAPMVWEFERFGAKVAAFNLGGQPYILLADHIKHASKRLIYEVPDLKKAVKELSSRGWESDGKKFGIPDGDCINFKDKSGNEYAILEISRPGMLEKFYKEP